MSTGAEHLEQAAFARLQGGMRMLSLSLPHFAGLAQNVRLQLDQRVQTMGIFASGRLLVNPAFIDNVTEQELIFILAHELYHLALKTHQRAQGTDATLFNVAHDYIINDILREELGLRYVPAGGLNWPGARTMSAERLLAELVQQRRAEEAYLIGAGEPSTSSEGDPGGARTETTLPMPKDPLAPDDVLSAEVEKEWFGGSAEEQQAQTHATEKLAEQALEIDIVLKHVGSRQRGTEPGATSSLFEALRSMYRPPWELALQRWLESVAPSARTFHRLSRRSGGRTDIVLPGRKREGWILHVIVDSSGSMMNDIPHVLGAIADFCEAAEVSQVRLMQCDTRITEDELLSPDQLANYQVSGFGGSDLTPAMLRLADDAEVEAVVILTDGEIGFPRDPMPYRVLWVLPRNYDTGHFQPGYGDVMHLPPLGGSP